VFLKAAIFGNYLALDKNIPTLVAVYKNNFLGNGHFRLKIAQNNLENDL
jgi:hypothetical protein